MATYNLARDGHPYLRHGYPVMDEHGREDGRFSTYQLHQRAEILLREADFPECGSLPRELFYALLVEGDLYNDARPDGIPISAVPLDMCATALEIASSFSEFFDEIKKMSPRPKFVLDMYRILIDNGRKRGINITDKVKVNLLRGASALSLARLLKNQKP